MLDFQLIHLDRLLQIRRIDMLSSLACEQCPEWAYRTVHPRAEPNRTVHFRAESPPRSKFSSASRTESGVSMLALDNVRFENIRAEPNRLLECSVWYGSARGCTVKSDVRLCL